MPAPRTSAVSLEAVGVPGTRVRPSEADRSTSPGPPQAIDLHQAAAYGGECWSPRTGTTRQEIGRIWSPCGVSDEWSTLRAVLLHCPGPELAVADANPAQMLGKPDLGLASKQHQDLAAAYRAAGVTVHYVDPAETPPPNLMLVADLFFMTPEGVILGRPASTVRAGEERLAACRLAALGIPIVRSVRGEGTFEGADAAWLDPRTVLLATGLRTNAAGARQVASVLEEMGVEVIPVGLPYGTMHLMGVLRIAGPDLAVAWPGRVPFAAVEALRRRGFRILFLPDEARSERRTALNFVTLAPGRILLPAGHRQSQHLYEEAGIECLSVDVSELAKAAGAVGCLTGVLEREVPSDRHTL